MIGKRMIFVTSPPACGKTKLSKKLATAIKHIVYLDKDTLIPLSKQIFAVAGQPYNRSSEFFEKEIRDYEYDVILDLAFEALKYEDLVMVNAPFTQEIRDNEYIANLRTKLKDYNAKLSVIWIVTDPEVSEIPRMSMRFCFIIIPLMRWQPRILQSCWIFLRNDASLMNGGILRL